ncbi:murein DD-endopeptidase MepM and murein hydrolase activator NlpD [Thermodesulfovibrio aggregans]|uniref:Murein DD-endopeptidase MepM and murein hydrolase activator NlpD n=1 Tax=Thermodesulfovibrio aggregans TaxID=86166 RepID=A0A0U9HWJ5_9BACT|nr:M23 family metallopeptidase [Thermodesulfovibrio aggregans]GAQ95165.1 murein DD-endopeptidase MepM and murein hydrolase activator NlpD [Thermodesulfovibrio aggregans]
MYKVRKLILKLFSPVTIMFIPHGRTKVYGVKLPFLSIFLLISLTFAFNVYVLSKAVNTIEYYRMKQEFSYIMTKFNELKSTIVTLKHAEAELSRIFSLKSKKEILESLTFNPSGDINIEELKKISEKAIESVSEIKSFLSQQHDIYRSTPLGWPVNGEITSYFGKREHPKYGYEELHTGIDISVPSGTEIKATADGIVVFSGYQARNGNVVMIKHGYGFTTVYAHNKQNLVTVGQRVKRGEIIAISGNTGSTTGPHLHYEVWKNNSPVNPLSYLKEDPNVF